MMILLVPVPILLVTVPCCRSLHPLPLRQLLYEGRRRKCDADVQKQSRSGPCKRTKVHDMPCFATSRPSSLPREGRRWSRCVEQYCTHSSTEMGASMVPADERCTAGAEDCFLKRFIVNEETQPMHPSSLPHSEAISPPKQRLFFGR